MNVTEKTTLYSIKNAFERENIQTQTNELDKNRLKSFRI